MEVILSIVLVICMAFAFEAIMSIPITKKKLYVSPKGLQVIIHGKQKKVQIYYFERSNDTLKQVDIDLDKCKMHFASDYNLSPYMDIRTEASHNVYAVLYFPESIEVQHLN